MKRICIVVGGSAFLCSLFLLASCAARRAMIGYYKNHPEMREKLLQVRTIYLEDVSGAESEEEARKTKSCLVEELWRKGKGRFKVVKSPERADAVLKADMREELGPVGEEEPLPFEIKPRFEIKSDVFLRMTLIEPRSGRLIYKTTTEENPEIDVDSPEKAAHTVIRNLVREIQLAEEKKYAR